MHEAIVAGNNCSSGFLPLAVHEDDPELRDIHRPSLSTGWRLESRL